MIHIITASPCYDFYVEVPNDFQAKEVIYYDYSEIRIGGKGLNVSRKLEEIGVKNKNYLFLGNKNSADYLRIYKESFNSSIEYIEYDGYVRTNFKFVKRDGNNIKVLKEMNKKPSELDDNSYESLVKLLCESYVDDEINFILLCGSVNPSNFYERFLNDNRLKKFKFIIDTSKEALAFCLQSDNIYLLKPNLDELKEINTDYNPFFDLIDENSEKNSEILEKFFISNSLYTNKNFYITNNKYDSYFYDATSKKCSVIKTENTGETKRSTVGAGDKSLAYTLYFLKQGKVLKDAVKEALSAISYELVTGKSYLKKD